MAANVASLLSFLAPPRYGKGELFGGDVELELQVQFELDGWFDAVELSPEL